MDDSKKSLRDAVRLICIMDKSPTRYISCRTKDTPEGKALEESIMNSTIRQAGLSTKPSPKK